ncbi:MAG: hypothetical protein KQI35_14375 [Bacteroidetes bacterium]|nr:hypothetical protein [Bacteroidota bacterium]
MKRSVFIFLLCFPALLFAQTIISGGNVSGVWNKCNSPYLIQGNPVIEENDSLIIDAGVEIVFYSDYYLSIYGNLVANGIEEDSIVFSISNLNNLKSPYTGKLYFISEGSGYSVINYAKLVGVNIESAFNYQSIRIENTKINNVVIYNDGSTGGVYFTNSKLIECSIFSIGNDYIINNSELIACSIDFNSFMGDELEMNDFIIRNSQGYAINTWATSVILKNGIIKDNFGGLNLDSDAGSTGGAQLENVTIEGCYGAKALIVYAVGFSLKNCEIKNNSGGSVYSTDCSVSINGCVFENNIGANGGGLCLENIYQYSNSKIENTIFRYNNASNKGGGLFITGLYNAQLKLNNVQFYGNTSEYGGGFYTGHVYNGFTVKDITVYNNSASVDGGGIYLDEPTLEILLDGATIVNNLAGNLGGGIFFNTGTIAPYPYNLRNNIFRNNSPSQIDGNDTSICHFEYSNIQDGWPGTGNIDTDPLFTDLANGDFSLSWANFPTNDATKSPCIDTGDPLSDPDPDGTIADMGAYFFNQSEPFEPTILSITDIPADQGLTVDINWKASITDDPTYNEITHYTIWREVTTSKSSWTYLGAMTADYSTSYSYIAPTLADSSEAGIPWFTFKIIAETSDPVIYYECQPDSGYSVDNLPPLAPTGLTGSFNNNIVTLNWDVSPDSDFDHFNIYKRDLSSSDPFLFLTSTTLITISENWFEYSNIEYRVTTVDINGNESDPGATWQTTVEPGFFANFKVMLEGPFTGSMMSTTLNEQDVIPLSQPYNTSPWNYNGTESVTAIPSPDIVDWILLELRQAPYVDYATSSTVVARKAAFLKSNGDIVAMDGMTFPRFDIVPSNDYYLAIWHRNHLGVLSAQPITMEEDQMTYDFTTGPDKYYHGIQGTKGLSAGTWGMIAADLNGDGIVDETDKSAGWNVEAGKSGYLFSDANLDAHTNNNDKNQLLYSNISLESQVPENYQFNCGDPLYDYRDGKYYTTVQIGNQCWMAENINIGEMICGIEDQLDNGIIEKYCYGNLSEYCDTMGGMYQWDEMMAYSSISGTQGICPIGWHIPTDDEWCELEDFVDTGNIDCEELGWKGTDAGYRLKSSNGWLNNGNGGDDFGFTALPAGYRSSADGNFYRLTKGSYLWSSDENDSGTAWRTGMEYNFSSVSKAFQLKGDGRSVRCIKDLL